MAALLIDVQPGDEIIMPFYTFISSANAFIVKGAKTILSMADPIIWVLMKIKWKH